MAVDGIAAPETSNQVNGELDTFESPVADQRPTHGSSTYAQDFVHKYQKRRPPINKTAELKLPVGQMEVISKYAEDFKAHSGHKRLSCYKPVDEIQKLGGTMQCQTTSHDAFCTKQLSPRFQRAPETYKKPETKMDCSTSYSSDFYARNEYCKLPPIKPQERKDSAKPFIATTENREQFKVYQRKDGGKQASYKPINEYVRPTEPFIGTSSYKGDFLQVKSDRPKPIKPQGNITITGEYFGGGRVTPPRQAPLVWKHPQPLSPIASNNKVNNFADSVTLPTHQSEQQNPNVTSTAVSEQNCRQAIDSCNQFQGNMELVSNGPH